MSDAIFDRARERIASRPWADTIELGRPHMGPPRLVESYVERGLMQRDGNALRLTELGREQHRIARVERSSAG